MQFITRDECQEMIDEAVGRARRDMRSWLTAERPGVPEPAQCDVPDENVRERPYPPLTQTPGPTNGGQGVERDESTKPKTNEPNVPD